MTTQTAREQMMEQISVEGRGTPVLSDVSVGTRGVTLRLDDESDSSRWTEVFLAREALVQMLAAMDR